MKKVLIISYYFPPAGGAGIQRVTKFAKYLSDFSWQPIVLSILEKYYVFRDFSLFKDLPQEMKVFRTPCPQMPAFLPWRIRNSFNQWFIPMDGTLLWNKNGIRMGLEIIKREEIDLIFSSSPPPSAHLVAFNLKKLTSKPWVADFRDLWVDNPYYKYPTHYHFNREKKWEGEFVKEADQIIFANSGERQYMASKYSIGDKCILITNGYDESDFLHRRIRKNHKFTITYAGSLYGLRTPDFFLKALKELKLSQKLPNSLVINFVGNIGSDNIKKIKEMELNDIINVTGYVEHTQSVDYLLNSDVLLLIEPSENVFTAKIFEYLAAQKYILALTPPTSDISRVVKEFACGEVINFNDVRGIKRTILDLYQAYKEDRLKPKADLVKIKKYERRSLTQKLATHFDRLVE